MGMGLAARHVTNTNTTIFGKLGFDTPRMCQYLYVFI